MFICVPFVFHLCSTCVHLCSTCVHLCSFVFHLCSLVFYLCSLVFICVHLCSFVFICVHLCSFVFICVHLCSLVFTCVLLCSYLWGVLDKILNCGVLWLAGTKGSICLICKQGTEDVTHFLLDCPFFKENVDSIWLNIKARVTETNPLAQGVYLKKIDRGLGLFFGSQIFDILIFGVWKNLSYFFGSEDFSLIFLR